MKKQDNKIPQTNKLNKTLLLTQSAFLLSTLIVSGFIQIPTPWAVPMTLQTMVLLLCGLILPFKEATMTIGTFLIAGAIGFPVFAGGAGGLTYFAGPTGGFLAGFACVRLTINLVCGFKPSEQYRWKLGLCCLAGLVPIYLGGVFWLHYGIGLSLKKAVLSGIVPFLPGALIKIAITHVIFTNLRERNVILKG